MRRRRDTLPRILTFASLIVSALLGYYAFNVWWGSLIFFLAIYASYAVKTLLFRSVPYSVGIIGVLEGILGAYLLYVAVAVPGHNVVPIKGFVSHPALGATLFLSLSYVGCIKDLHRIYFHKLHEINSVAAALISIDKYEHCHTSLALAALQTARLFGPCPLLHDILFNLERTYKLQDKYDAARQVVELKEYTEKFVPVDR